MKYSFQLPYARRANVWLDEPPPASFSASSTVTRTVKPRAAVDATRKVAAVELNIPHGPTASYALLGAELVDSNVDGLEVVVMVNSVGFPFASSLALKPDDVTVGLLDEYTSAVVAGIEKAGESRGLPTNASLRFRWAAHGVVGSSPSIFEKVSGLVVQLLTLPKGASEGQLAALFGEVSVSQRSH
jgi:hypothetical protein